MSEAAARAIEAECYDVAALAREAAQPGPPRRILTEEDVRQLIDDRLKELHR